MTFALRFSRISTDFLFCKQNVGSSRNENQSSESNLLVRTTMGASANLCKSQTACGHKICGNHAREGAKRPKYRAAKICGNLQGRISHKDFTMICGFVSSRFFVLRQRHSELYRENKVEKMPEENAKH